MRMSYGLNAFSVQQPPHKFNITNTSNTCQHECPHSYTCSRLIARPASTLRYFSFLFHRMSCSQPACLLCHHCIIHKRDGRPINSIADEGIKRSILQEPASQSYRVHIKCAKYPHIHIKTKVNTIQSQASTWYVLHDTQNDIK